MPVALTEVEYTLQSVIESVTFSTKNYFSATFLITLTLCNVFFNTKVLNY